MEELLISRYHPAVESYADLRAIFVGADRQRLLEELLADIGRAAPDTQLQPRLILGPRGIGKTHFLWMLFHRVNQDARLRDNWIPVVMREELFEVKGVADVLIGALEHVAGRSNPQRAGNVRESVRSAAMAGLNWTQKIKNRQTRFDRARSVFEDISRKHKVRFILVVENLDMLCAEFPRNELNNIEALIANSVSVLLLGSAVTTFDAIRARKGPLYGYFRPHHLQLLEPDELFELVSRLMERYASRHEAAVDYLRTPDGLRRKHLIQALAYLSGGLPRMVFPLFEFAMAECGALAGAADTRSLRQKSLGMIKDIFDDLTEVYVDRLRHHVPARERTVLLALASAETTLRPKDIAARTGLSAQQVSNTLVRLAEKRLVRVATLVHGREQYYLPTEPLLGLWDQWRSGASEEQKWSFIPELLALLFTKEELDKRLKSPNGDRAFYAKALERAPALEKIFAEAATPFAPPRRGAVLYEEEIAAVTTRTQAPPYAAIRGRKRRLESSDAESLFNRAVRMHEKGLLPQAVELYGQLVARFGDRSELHLACVVAAGLVNMGSDLGAQGKSEEEIRVYDEVVKRYGDRKEAGLAEHVAKALVNKGVCLGAQGKSEEEIRVYDEVVERYGDRKEAGLAELVAGALVNKAIALARLSRTGEARKRLLGVLERVPERLHLLGMLSSLSRIDLEALSRALSPVADPSAAGVAYAGPLEDARSEFVKVAEVLSLVRAGLLGHYLAEGNIPGVDEAASHLLAMPDEGVELVSFVFLDLFGKKRIKEANLLAERLGVLGLPAEILGRLESLVKAARICRHMEAGEVREALEIVQKLNAAERVVVLRLLDGVLGKDWLRKAQEQAAESRRRVPEF